MVKCMDGVGVFDELAGLNPDAIVSDGFLARAFKAKNTKTIQRMERRGELPASFKLRGRRSWFAGEVLKHLHARADAAEREAVRERTRLRKHEDC